MKWTCLLHVSFFLKFLSLVTVTGICHSDQCLVVTGGHWPGLCQWTHMRTLRPRRIQFRGLSVSPRCDRKNFCPVISEITLITLGQCVWETGLCGWWRGCAKVAKTTCSQATRDYGKAKRTSYLKILPEWFEECCFPVMYGLNALTSQFFHQLAWKMVIFIRILKANYCGPDTCFCSNWRPHLENAHLRMTSFAQ